MHDLLCIQFSFVFKPHLVVRRVVPAHFLDLNLIIVAGLTGLKGDYKGYDYKQGVNAQNGNSELGFVLSNKRRVKICIDTYEY